MLLGFVWKWIKKSRALAKLLSCVKKRLLVEIIFGFDFKYIYIYF